MNRNLSTLALCLLLVLITSISFGQTGTFRTITGGVAVATETVDLFAGLKMLANGSNATNLPVSAGATVEPSFIASTTAGVIMVESCCVRLYDNDGFVGVPKEYTFDPATFTLNDETTNYIVADYNGGSPVIRNATDVEEITESDVVPILTIYRKAGFLHSLNWDQLGRGLANKLHQRLVKTARYRRESGIALTVAADLTFSVSAGKVWYGATRESLMAVESGTDTVLLVSPDGTATTTTKLNNTQYITTGSVVSTLTANRYAVNWVYRGIENQKHVYIMLGTGDYTINAAQNAVAPAAPALITSHAQLIAKVIIQKSSTTPTSQQSAFDTEFSTAASSIHNDLSGLNDGDSYEHLTAAEKTQALVGSTTVDFSASTVRQYPGSIASIRNSFTYVASGTTIALETLVGALSTQAGRLTIVDLTNYYTASFSVRGAGSPALIIIDDVSSKFSITAVAGKHCLVVDGDGTFSFINNYGNAYYLIQWVGRE